MRAVRNEWAPLLARLPAPFCRGQAWAGAAGRVSKAGLLEPNLLQFWGLWSYCLQDEMAATLRK